MPVSRTMLPGLPGLTMLGLVLPVAMLSGCLTHEARITAPPDTVDIDEGATAIGRSDTVSPPGPPEQTLLVSPLPLAVPVSAWRRDQDGVLWRSDMEVATPLPWWQRFPVDFATDMLPISYHAEVAATIVARPVTPRTRDDLEQEARAAGYAPAQTTSPAPVTEDTPTAPAVRSAP